jgi:hypothetical protein
MQAILPKTSYPHGETLAATNRACLSQVTARLAVCGPTLARILLGLIFAVFGTCGLLGLLPPPPPTLPAGALAFGTAVFKTGYLFQLIKGTEAVVGLLLLANRFVPLALTVLAPVVINIIAFHVFLDPSGLAIPLLALALHVYLAWSYRSVYRSLLAVRAVPTVACKGH